jgi:hypothetical protein
MWKVNGRQTTDDGRRTPSDGKWQGELKTRYILMFMFHCKPLSQWRSYLTTSVAADHIECQIGSKIRRKLNLMTFVLIFQSFCLYKQVISFINLFVKILMNRRMTDTKWWHCIVHVYLGHENKTESIRNTCWTLHSKILDHFMIV